MTDEELKERTMRDHVRDLLDLKIDVDYYGVEHNVYKTLLDEKILKEWRKRFNICSENIDQLVDFMKNEIKKQTKKVKTIKEKEEKQKGED
jgi:hypothetical protein